MINFIQGLLEFNNLLNMSISACWIILAVILLRLILKKSPKNIRCIMWALVAFRLICPFSIESVLSLIPSTEVFPAEIFRAEGSQLSNNAVLDIVTNPVYSSDVTYELPNSIDRVQFKIMYATLAWFIGMGIMLLYAVISYIRLYIKIREAIPHKDNIYICDQISTPFILGIFRPKIYLPSYMSEADAKYVTAHEKAHLKRLDHIWKPLGFAILTVHWFNPAVWLAYILFCRDIELACDEKVIKELGTDSKKAYSNALISCSAPKYTIAAYPLAFGETDIKGRIKSVLSYKKPTLWIIIISVISCIAVAVCFVTNPSKSQSDEDSGIITLTGSGVMNGESDMISGRIVSADLKSDEPYIEVEWSNHTDTELTFGEEFYIYQLVYGELVDCRSTPDDYGWADIAYEFPANGTFTKKYSLEYIDIDEPGTYLLETDVYIDSVKDIMWIELEIGDTEFSYSNQYFRVSELIYDDSVYSYYQTAENAHQYQVWGRTLYERKDENEQWLNLGILEEIYLDEDNFDSRFTSEFSDAKQIRKNNSRAWQLKLSRNGNNELYIILKQNDGTYYLAYGYYDTESEFADNSDKSSIRWLYKLNHIFEENTQTVKQ